MAYSSDFHYFPAAFTPELDGVSYATKATLENITNLIQAHWHTEEKNVTLENFKPDGSSYTGRIPLIVNDNLPCGFTWMIPYGNPSVFVVIDLNTNEYKTAIYRNAISSFSVCMPNAQNVIIEATVDYSGKCYYVLSAVQDMAANGQPFKTIVLCTDHYSTSQSYMKNIKAFSMSEPDRDVFTIDAGDSRVQYQYGTMDLLRMLGTAVFYGIDTVYESDRDMFIAPLDISVKTEPESIIINDIEYLGISFNPHWTESQRTQARYNYYFRIESED